MVRMYYFMIKSGTVTNINQIAKSYRERVAVYIANYGYAVAEDGTITKSKTTE